MAKAKHKAKKKARGRPFKPGQSGNPGGRPRALTEFRLAARAYSTQALEILRRIMCSRRSAASARVRAAGELLDRAWGRPVAEVLVQGAMASVEVPATSWQNLTGAERVALGRKLAFLLQSTAHAADQEEARA